MAFPWIGFILFMGNMALQIAMAHQKKSSGKREPLGQNSWGQLTTQKPTTIDLDYGTTMVTGNIFGQYATVHNDLVAPSNGLWVILSLIVDIVQGFLPWSVRVSREELGARIGLTDGPVLGLRAGYSRLNDVAVTDVTGVIFNERLGTDIQVSTLTGDVIQIPCDNRVVEGASVTVEMTDANYSDCAIVLTSQEGLAQYGSSTGKKIDDRFRCRIEIGVVGSGVWQIIFEGPLLGRILNPVYWRFVASESYYGGSPYTVTLGDRHVWRVTNLYEHNSDSARGQLRTWNVQQIYGDNNNYPGLAYVEVTALASDKLNGALHFKGVLDAKIVEDVETGVLAWSDNPANIIQDLLCRPCIKGSGDSGDPYVVEYYRGYDPDDFSAAAMADFIALKAWCDALVSDGKGGTQKRFRFSGRFTDQQERWEQAAKVAAMCRANLWYDGKWPRIWIDKTTTAAHLFCSANMFVPYDGGTERSVPSGGYREWSVDRRKVPSVVEGTIESEDAGWETVPIKYGDRNANNTHAEVLDGFGCPCTAQFVRSAQFMFDKQRNLQKMCEIPTDVNGLDVNLGEVAYVQYDGNGRAVGGCVVSATADTVVLDTAVEMESGTTYNLVLQTIDSGGKHITKYTVESLTDEKTVHISTDFTYIPERGDCFIFAASDKLDQYRIIGSQSGPDGRCTFLAEQYLEAYYAADSDNPAYDTNTFVGTAGHSHSSGSGLSREQLQNLVDEDYAYGGDNVDQVVAGNLTFTGDGVDSVSWQGLDPSYGVGWIRLNGKDYPISSDAVGTTDMYIYFEPSDDSGNDQTLLQHTNDINDLRGQMRYLGCINVDGDAFPQNWVLIGQDVVLPDLGTMAYQDKEAVEITGGTAKGLTELEVDGQAYFDAEVVNDLDSGGAATIDWRLGNKQMLNLTADCTLTMIPPDGVANCILRVIQDVAAGHSITWVADSGEEVYWTNRTAPDVAAAAVANEETMITLYWTGTAWRGGSLPDFGADGT